MTERDELKKALSDVLVLRAKLEREEYKREHAENSLADNTQRMKELQKTIKQMRDLVFTFAVNVRLSKKIARMAARVEEPA